VQRELLVLGQLRHVHAGVRHGDVVFWFQILSKGCRCLGLSRVGVG
jgi:hypothetical protein